MMTIAVALLVGWAQSSYPAYAVQPLSGITIPGLPAVTSHICVDQFGYLPDGKKVAVISDPVKGYNAGDHYTPGPKLEVRKRSGQAVFSGAPTPWNGGAVHEDSGDRGWWFDFSTVSDPGEYYVFDPSTGLRSPVFHVGKSVYSGVLRASMRMFYYQRLGMPIEAKYAQGPWVDDAAYLEDKHTKSVTAKDSGADERDMSGGWMDAGDSDKYPPSSGDVLHPLLYAYTANPKAFADDFGIPESGNGLPDILDEVKYELDWLLRMQFEDGSVSVKMGHIDFSDTHPLSQDHRPRYYGPKDSGATLAACGVFAHAARVYGQFPAWKAYAATLRERAMKAWNWCQSNPRTFNTDTGEIKAGLANRSDKEQDRLEAFAAIQLLALTGDEKYQSAIRDKIGSTLQLSEPVWSPYEVGASESLVDYMSLPHADSALVERIRARLAEAAESAHFAPPASADLYRAWMEPTNYHWGSSTVRASWGVVALLAADHGGVDAATKAGLYERAADMLHSFHGVNPLSVVYLTNMGKYGAEHSLTAMFHGKYGAGSPFSHNPPPGYVVGGPNQSFSGQAGGGRPSIEWIKAQPRGKAYADFDLGWPESSWELTEPDIGYQAMYVRLLAAFVH
jgi:hypothetical protein